MTSGSTKERVVQMAKLGIRPALIAERVERKPATVYHYIRQARLDGVEIPKFETGPTAHRQNTIVGIGPETTSALRVAAHRRGLTVQELVKQLVNIIAREQLVAVIMNDEVIT